MFGKNIFRNYVLPVATLSGAIIGVGFFSLPYITLQVGTWPMLFYFFILGALVVSVHLIFGEIALLTPDFKRFPGFVKFHLGKLLGSLYLISTILGSFSVLLVYLIIGSDFLKNIFGSVLNFNVAAQQGNSGLFYVLIFWGIVSFIIFFGIKIISKVEFVVIAFIFLALIIIFISGFDNIKISNFFIPNFSFQIDHINPFALDKISTNFLLAYGPIIFSLWGMGAIPEIEEMLGKNKKNIKKITIISFLIVLIIYLFFIFLILGMSGANTTETALTGLKKYLNPVSFSISLFLGVITTFTASVMLGLTFKKVLIYDLGIKKIKAWLIVCLVPLILYFLGFKSFIPIISFVGGVLLGIDGILILLMYKKIRGKSLMVYPLISVFLLGIVYEISRFL